ncbi:MAG TPA: condensation domain-containing protein [Propionibacteriaceae bacterium]|nr:condensation domain-containing protein [Propionibacteriaceae bacterium]
MDISDRSVSIRGAESRTGPLSWSQLYMWDWLSQMRPYDQQYNTSVELETATPIALDHALNLVAALVSRHESLRTRYYSGPAGSLMQETGGSGLVRVSISDDVIPSDQTASAILKRKFDLSGDPPCHFTLIRDNNNVRKIVLTSSHLVIDGWSAGVLRQDFADLLSRQRLGILAKIKHPLDRAAWERSSQGQEANQAGLAHWTRILSGVPRAHFTRQTTHSSPRYQRAQMSSIAAGRAVRALALENRVPQAAVPLTAFSRAVRSVTGNRRNAFWIVTHNRFKGGFRRSVGCFFRDTLVCLDESPRPLLNTSAKLLESLRWTNTNPRDVVQILHNDDRASYFSLARSLYYNFTSHEATRLPDLPLDKVEWTDGKDFDSQVLYLNVHLEGECLIMRLMADTWCVPRAAAEDILQECVQDIVQSLPPMSRAHRSTPPATAPVDPTQKRAQSPLRFWT